LALPGYRTCRMCLLPVLMAASGTPLAEHIELPELQVDGAAQENILSLPSIYAAVKRIKQTPGGVNIIDAESYKAGRVSTIKDALGWSPGVFVQPRFGANESRLSIRGSGLQRTFHLRGIKLLQDGVPLNQADGGGDFQALEPLALRYIEVYRGANALAYGSTTLGGAINFVSPSGYDASPLQARAEFGSFGLMRGQFSSGGHSGNLDYYASLSHFSQDGFRDNAKQNNERFFGNVGYRINRDVETRFFFTALDSDSRLPGDLTKAQLEADPTQANGFNAANNFQRDFPLFRIANRTSFRWGNSQLDVGLFYINKDLFHPIFQVLDIVSEDYGADFRFTKEGKLFGRKNLFTAGFSPVLGDNQDDRFVNVGGVRGARTGQSDQRAVNIDFYLENQHYVVNDLALVTGAQLSWSRREFDDKFLADGDNSFDEIYTAFSPKLGLRYDFNEEVQFFTNVSRNFEPPSFPELSGGPNVTQVDAQTATSFEIGTRGHAGIAEWDAVYYRVWVKDELLSLSDGLGNPLGTINASETIHQGIELGLQVNLFDRLQLRQLYLWNDFHFEDDPVNGDNRLGGVPEHFYRAELLYQDPQGFYFGPNVEWVPDDYAVDHANTLFADSYAILGFKAGYRKPYGLSVFVEGRNLTDKTYAATTNVIADAGGGDAAVFLPGDGASVFVGIEWRN